MLSALQFILIGVIIYAVFNVISKMWQHSKQSQKSDDMDAQIDHDLASDRPWYSLSLWGWLVFIFDGSPKFVMVLGLVLAVYAGIACQKANEFEKQSIPVEATIIDDATSTVQFNTLDGKEIRTALPYRVPFGQSKLNIRYSTNDPNQAEAVGDIYGPAHVLIVFAALTLTLGIYRWYLFRPKAPIKDWRGEI